MDSWSKSTNTDKYKHTKKCGKPYYSGTGIHYFFNVGKCKWTSTIGASVPFSLKLDMSNATIEWRSSTGNSSTVDARTVRIDTATISQSTCDTLHDNA